MQFTDFVFGLRIANYTPDHKVRDTGIEISFGRFLFHIQTKMKITTTMNSSLFINP